MKTKTMTLPTILLMLMMLTACDPRSAERNFKAERANRAYQSAMQELSAGRMAVAVDAFKAVLRADSGNTSAHFQLACLLQDHQHDYLGAIGEYQVFLLLAPKSEKAELAQARITRCEQLYRERLLRDEAAKISNALKTENDRLTQSLSEAEASRERLKTELASAQTKLVSEQKENARLRTLMESHAEESEAPKFELPVVRELLEEEEPLAPASMAEALRLAAAAEAEERAAGSHAGLLGEDARNPAPAAKVQPQAEVAAEPPRPDAYVVQDGDTLYKIANRFYGRTSAWKRIREANPETISTDGRIRAGQKIRLP